jgi:hypothetical protein
MLIVCALASAPKLKVPVPVVVTPPVNVPKPLTPNVLLRVVAPVTPNVPPTVALFVTARPVPAEVNDAAPLQVLAPAAACDVVKST